VLHRLATDLSRLMAPLLCFTSEELWQELETLQGREPWKGRSIHAETFPDALELPEDDELLSRWERLIQVRDEASKALELARAAGTIGSSLEARLVIEANDDTRELLRSFGDGLRFLFIVSEIELGSVGSAAWRSETLPGLSVEVQTAPGTKCERCWNYTVDVGSSEEWPGVCDRCLGHIREIHSGAGST
jgi:isoleucyl-tRNA synthetase